MASAAQEASDNADRRAYFDALNEGFARATRARPAIEQFFDIAGLTVCVQAAGDALAGDLTRALAHRAVPAATPAFTIRVWDDASTDTQLPLLIRRLIWSLRRATYELLGPRREIKELDGQRIRTSFFIGPDILSAVDLDRNIGLYWIESADRLPYWERGSPFLALLSWWMASRGWNYVHAGAVGHPDGGVLLAGKGGSGKSTTALSCLASPLVYASDDYCLVSTRPSPRVASIYSTAKLKGEVDFQRFPHLRERCSNVERLGSEKAVLFLQEHYPHQLIAGFPIRAVLLPHVVGEGPSSVSLATSADAFRALAPSSLMQVPGAGPGLLMALRTLVEQVPAFHLHLGADARDLPAVIGDVLATLPAPAASVGP